MNANENQSLKNPLIWRHFCLSFDHMITRREVLRELGRLGLRDLSEIKQGCREYEDYMAAFYGLKIIKKGKEKTSPHSQARSLPQQVKKSSLLTVKAIFMS